MIRRFTHAPDGAIRFGRLVILLGLAIAMALAGTGLLGLTTRVSDSALGRSMWVILVTFIMKFPLVAVLWSFIRRNTEWPGKPIVWGDEELQAILDRLTEQAAASDYGEHAIARLQHLSREAWHIADTVSGQAKVDALTVALHIDERLMGRRAQERAW